MREYYRTIEHEAIAEFEEKKSRFIAAAKPVANEEEAIAFINGIRTQHRMASHNVYAYYTANLIQSKRYSDDGEPQGTAGIPVLDVIVKNGLEDVVIVVTRYFGGVLLGAAGLVRAYGKSAAAAIEKAGLVEKRLADEWSILVDYALFQQVKNEVEKSRFAILRCEYGADVEISVQIPRDLPFSFSERLADLTNGTAIAQIVGKSYMVSAYRKEESG